MERSDENLWFCEEQILRLEVTRFYDRLTLVGKQELRDALCDSASSRTAAELRVTTWIRLHPDCPSGADFGLMEMAEQREARAQVSWKSEPPPPSDGRKCQGCEKWGCIKVNGRWEFCSCADGRDLRAKLPDYVEFCNSFEGPMKSQVLGAIHRDLTPTARGPIAASKFRCAKCSDTGRIIRPNQVIWCTCPPADELKNQYRVTDYPKYRQAQIKRDREPQPPNTNTPGVENMAEMPIKGPVQ